MANNIPITQGTGQSSVAAETVAGISYQQIEVYGAGGASVLSIDPSGAMRVSVVGTIPTTITGSVITLNIGSIVTTNVGSVITVLQAASIVGTYAEDAPSAGTDKGIFMLGVRNDTVASLVSADLDYGARTSDSAGRTLIKPFAAEEARVEGYNSVVSTSVTTLVAAAGVGLRNYITDVMVANTGATTTLITFKDGLGSILGYTVAPTGGGSNIIGMMMPIRTGANATFDFQPTSASSILFVTVKGYKAP